MSGAVGRGGGRGKTRSGLVWTGLQRSLQSRLAHFVLLATFALAIALRFRGVWYCKLPLLLPLFLAVVSRRVLFFELAMSLNMLQHMLNWWNWFNLVDDNLFCGAALMLPGDPPVISKKLGVNAILCTLEEAEMGFVSLFGTMVPPELWSRYEIAFHHIPFSDSTLPSFDLLSRAANVINLHLSENRRVYVYCRSGCSRSASAVIAYFIKHRGMGAKEAFDKLLRKRRINFRWGSRAANHLMAYEASFRGGSTLS